jgi:hypothetical protein
LTANTPLGDLIDKAAKIRESRDAKAKEVVELKDLYETLEQDILQRLKETNQTLAGGKIYKLTTVENTFYSIDPTKWDEFNDWKRENKADYLMRRAPSRKALAEAVQSGRKIPGIKAYTETKISLTKIR